MVRHPQRHEGTPEREARRVADLLGTGRGPRWQQAGEPGGPWGSAQVCRVQRRRVLHVVGDSEMAEALRRLFTDGAVAGWQLQPLPKTRTPLHHYLAAATEAAPQRGSLRGYNQLDRFGFSFGEEVAACPDDALLAINNIGPTALAAIREIFGHPLPVPDQVGGPSVTPAVPAREVPLTPAAAARYPDFARRLTITPMPEQAVHVIAAALNAEPLPAVDPTVELLLDTAGEAELLALYRATHRSS